MAASGLLFAGMTAVVKHAGQGIPAAQSGFLRYAMGLPFLIPMLGPIWRSGMTARQMGLFGLRGAVHTVAVICWFFAMTRIPMAEVTAIGYLTPVFVTLGAALLLGDVLRGHRMAAIGLALLGAGIVLRPGLRELQPAHLSMLVTASCFAVSYLLAKPLSQALPATVVVGMLTITVTLGLLPFALAVWVAPTMVQLAWYVLVAAFATLGHIAMTRAFAAAPLSVTQPVVFLQLVWSTSIGFVIFAEPVDLWVIVGGLTIVAAVSWATLRDRAGGRATDVAAG